MVFLDGQEAEPGGWGKRWSTEQIIRMKNFYKQQGLGDDSFRNPLKVPKYKVAEQLCPRSCRQLRRHLLNLPKEPPQAPRGTHVFPDFSRASRYPVSPRETLMWRKHRRKILICKEDCLTLAHCARRYGKRGTHPGWWAAWWGPLDEGRARLHKPLA